MTFAQHDAGPARRRGPGAPLRRLRASLLGISPEEASFARRGFAAADDAARRRLEAAGRAFVTGYRAALDEDRPAPLAAGLSAVEPELRGFAFEGAAMGLALLDRLTPWRRDRIARFLRGPGHAHAYMVHVGVGWALARLGRRVDDRAALPDLDPLLRWLAADGYGFHEGYFRWPRAVRERRVPQRIAGYARRAFDQGLGRSLWFVEGAAPERIAATVAGFPASRRADLWSGVGLACAYAGGAGPDAVESLGAACGPFRAAAAQGAAFAAKARARAGNPAAHTELACEALCGMPAARAALVTDRALDGLPGDGAVPAYEVWRRRVQETLAAGAASEPDGEDGRTAAAAAGGRGEGP